MNDGAADPSGLDRRFRSAVAAIDAGDAVGLDDLIRRAPALVHARLESPGAWLRDAVGSALEGYFARPYLVWFVAGNPVRRERLPAGILAATRTILDALQHENVAAMREQLDHALELVATGRVPRESGVQIELIDLLLDRGARPGSLDAVLGERELAAARHLVERGAPVSLAAALCLELDAEADRLLARASPDGLQAALTAAAINGKASALQRLVERGADPSRTSSRIHPHASALHHAVFSGSLCAVRVLVESGGDVSARDRGYGATPLGWAEHGGHEEIASYLRARSWGGPSR